jgi:aryl-alcohol dehydrogenase-like predicted oxidoreductase
MTPTPRRPRAARRPSAPPPPPTIGTIPIAGLPKPHPEIGLGLWNRGRWERDTEAQIGASIDRALDRGVRWFDTAEVYGAGRSERLLGAALGEHEALIPQLLIVTKVSWEHLRASQIRGAIQGSLERLGRPKVDLYLVHAPDEHVPITETMATLGEIMDQGRIDAIGVSNFSVEELEAARSALGERRLVVNQVRYNLIEREDGDPLRDYCRDHGILIEAYTPLCHGLLAGRFLKDGTIPAATRRGVRSFSPEKLRTTFERARALQRLAEKAHVPLASIAFHWLRLQGAAPLFGASQPGQVDDNLAAWAKRPPKGVLEAADAITAEPHA